MAGVTCLTFACSMFCRARETLAGVVGVGFDALDADNGEQDVMLDARFLFGSEQVPRRIAEECARRFNIVRLHAGDIDHDIDACSASSSS